MYDKKNVDDIKIRLDSVLHIPLFKPILPLSADQIEFEMAHETPILYLSIDDFSIKPEFNLKKLENSSEYISTDTYMRIITWMLDWLASHPSYWEPRRYDNIAYCIKHLLFFNKGISISVTKKIN